MTKMMFELM